MGQSSSCRSLRAAIKSPFNCLLDETNPLSSLFPYLSRVLFFRLGRGLISHQPFQFRCNLHPVCFVHEAEPVSLASSLPLHSGDSSLLPYTWPQTSTICGLSPGAITTHSILSCRVPCVLLSLTDSLRAGRPCLMLCL